MTGGLLDDAVAAHRAGDLPRARSLYEEVLRAEPGQADALHLLGLVAQQSGDLSRARALIEASIAARPNVAAQHFNLGLVLALQGLTAGAIIAYETAVRLAPDFADAQSNLGNLYLQAGRHVDALRSYAAALRAKPDFAAVYSNLGTVLIQLERFDEAIEALHTSLRLTPNIPEAYANLGQALRRSGRFREAIAATQHAIELRPDYRDAYLNLAIAAYAAGAFDLSLNAYLRVLELGPVGAEVHSNVSSVYHALGRYDEAIAECQAAIALRPDYVEAHVNLAVSLLVRGDFVRGWDEYTWMWRLPAKRASYPYADRATLWNGETFRGRQLLVTRDQGFGDAIQMARYLPGIKARGGRVVLEAAPELTGLFASLGGVDELRAHVDGTIARDDVELYIPISGLPRAFRTDLTTIPATVPYLRASAESVERWRPRLQSAARLRVGIVWSGNANHDNDANRSCRLEDFAALGAIDGVAWFGLQKGRDDERRTCGALTLEPLGAQIADFSDTAAIITHLDLVIAVDTSIVHLAGAMGKPVWTLLAFVPDWRWLLERKDSPWYPTMRLFRQPSSGDWATVFAEVTRELRDQISESNDVVSSARVTGTTNTGRGRREP